mgnify:CR=1 FL=1
MTYNCSVARTYLICLVCHTGSGTRQEGNSICEEGLNCRWLQPTE